MCLVGGLVAASPAGAGEKASLCRTVDGAHIPTNLMVEACYDGTAIVLENNSDIVLRANTTPSVARPSLGPAGPVMPTASAIVLAWEAMSNPDPDPYLLPPGAKLTIPTGSAGNSITIEVPGTGYRLGFAQWATNTLPVAGHLDTVVSYLDRLSQIQQTWGNCAVSSNFLGDVGCTAAAAADIQKANITILGPLAIDSLKSVVGSALGFIQTAADVDNHVESLITFQRTEHTITVDPHASGGAARHNPPDYGPSPYESDIYFRVSTGSGEGWIPDTYFVRDKGSKLGLPHC